MTDETENYDMDTPCVRERVRGKLTRYVSRLECPY
jgi:hypothetical protein